MFKDEVSSIYAFLGFTDSVQFDGDQVHLQWFEHGSNTLVGEFAAPRELFLLSMCDDNPIECIVNKIEVDFVRDDTSTTSYDVKNIEAEFWKVDHYFYRNHWAP